MKLNLKVNGKNYELDVDPSKPLLNVIREDLGLTGTKYGCGSGECGVCTILLDGKPAPSCVMLAAQANNHEITTIEGVYDRPLFKKIEEMFIATGVVQCGYCIPGFVLISLYLLEKNPKPTREEIKEAISGAFCRCGGGQRIVDAIELIAKGAKPKVVSSTSEVVGKTVGRTDARNKIRGKAVYGYDLKPIAMRRYKDLLFLKFLKSPHPHARIKSISTEEAEAMEGVELVLTHKNVPDVMFTTTGQDYPDVSPHDTRFLNNPVRFVGEPVAIVAAKSEKIAEEALNRIKVEYEPLEPILDPRETLKPTAPKIHPNGNVVSDIRKEVGSVDEGFQKADVVIEREYETPIQKQVNLEPHASLAHFDGDELVIDTSNQAVFACRRILSQILNQPMHKLRVKSWAIGGGFGNKQDLVLEHYVALVTQKTGKPSYASINREEDFYLTKGRHPMIIKVKLGAKKSGELTAISYDVISDTGAYGQHGITVTLNTGPGTMSLYSKKCKNLRFNAKIVYTNRPPSGAFRGYGAAQGYFALESAMDELAESLKMDPVDLRLANAIGEGDIVDPFAEVLMDDGKPVPEKALSCGLQEALRTGRKLFGWDKKKGKGVGVACAMMHSGVPGSDQASSLAILHDDGTITVTIGSSDIGQGIESIMTQIAAEALGAKFEDVRVISADTDRTLFDKGTYASSGTYVSGNAVKRACDDLKQKILERAARKMGKRKDALDIKDGKIYVKAKPSNFISLKDMAMDVLYGIKKGQLTGRGDFKDMISPRSFFVSFVEAKVDKETGKVKLERYLALADCGTPINPTAALGQAEGGITQGIGYCLFEGVSIGKDGKVLNPDLTNYKIPSIFDLPKIEVKFVNTYEPTGPFGAKSIGEASLVTAAPAIANAIYDGTGVRFRKLPLTREKIAMAMLDTVDKK